MRVSLPHFLIGYQVLPLKANSLVSNNYPEASVVSTAWNTIATSTLSWLLISYFLLLISQSIQGCPFLVFFPWFCGRVSWSRWTSNPLSSQGWSSTLDPPVSSQVLGLDYRGSSPGCTYRLFLFSILCLLHKAQKAAVGKGTGSQFPYWCHIAQSRKWGRTWEVYW